MTIAEPGADYDIAPPDYDTFFRQWFPYVAALVRRHGVDEDRKEDVASAIFARLFERDFLQMYDPTLVFKYNGQERPAKFKSFLSKVVLLYLRSFREKQNRSRSRELLLCDTPVGDDGDRPWVEVYGGQVASHESHLIECEQMEETVERLRMHLGAVDLRGERDMCDLVALFDAVIVQVRDHGCYDVSALTAQFHTSATSMHAWLWRLKEEMAAATDRAVPAKRPRVLRRAADQAAA